MSWFWLALGNHSLPLSSNQPSQWNVSSRLGSGAPSGGLTHPLRHQMRLCGCERVLLHMPGHGLKHGNRWITSPPLTSHPASLIIEIGRAASELLLVDYRRLKRQLATILIISQLKLWSRRIILKSQNSDLLFFSNRNVICEIKLNIKPKKKAFKDIIIAFMTQPQYSNQQLFQYYINQFKILW